MSVSLGRFTIAGQIAVWKKKRYSQLNDVKCMKGRLGKVHMVVNPTCKNCSVQLIVLYFSHARPLRFIMGMKLVRRPIAGKPAVAQRRIGQWMRSGSHCHQLHKQNPRRRGQRWRGKQKTRCLPGGRPRNTHGAQDTQILHSAKQHPQSPSGAHHGTGFTSVLTLVVEPTHLKKISQDGNLPQGVKMKNISNYHRETS